MILPPLVFPGPGHEVLVEVDNNSLVAVINTRESLGQQLKPCAIHILNSIINTLIPY
jgi:hypothetical protein